MLKTGFFSSLLIGVSCASLLSACGGTESDPETGSSSGQTAQSSTRVEIATVGTSTLADSLQSIGTLRANESTVISPELGGRIAEIHFQEGDSVERAEPLFSLDAAIYEAEMAQARANLELSRANYERAEQLLKSQVGSATAHDEALAQLRIDEAELALAEARLQKTTINAPFDGTVGLRTISVGDYLQPGEELVTLVDLDPIKVDFRVPELALSAVQAGQTVEVELGAFPGESFTGTVYAVAPQVDVNGRSLLVRARIPNPEHRLKPGQFARVDLIVEQRGQALLIPEEAIVPQGNGQFVFRVVDGKAVRTEVQTGQRREGHVEIIDGLEAGQEVVIAGQMKISDGAMVEAKAAGRSRDLSGP